MSEAELASIVWRAPEWIQAFGGLRLDNVLEYFSQSPFFDRKSNNAVLKMQSQFQNFGDANEALRKMRGVEFVVGSQTSADLFIINKQEREAYDEARIINVYFIANGNIYMAPDTHSVVGSRMVNLTQALKAAVDKLNQAVEFDSSRGYTYHTAPEPTVAPQTVTSDATDPSSSLTESEINSMHKVLFNTVNRI